MVAVIPTFVLAGPAALLAALFPAVFAGLALFWRRWAILLAVASVGSSLLFAHAWLRGYAAGVWWGTPAALWVCLAVVSGAGALLSWRRVLGRRRSGQVALLLPGRLAVAGLSLASLAGLGMVLYAWNAGVLLRWPWRECLPVVVTVCAGALFLLCARVRHGAQPHGVQPVAASAIESVMLAALAAACLLVAALVGPRPAPLIVWTFEAVDRGLILSAPLVDGDRVYASAAHSNGLNLFGSVYCLDRASGKQIWTFNNSGRMKQVFSSPALDAGRLYVGEGLHEDADCRLYCLDAATGRELWSFVTKSHTESSPRLADGCVFFGAGDDGAFCLDAVSGKVRWHFPGLHVDATPAIVGRRLYAGSSYGSPEMFCLDTTTGRPLWRTPSDLSVFGCAVLEGQVFFGVGNGKLNRSDPRPAGALVCLDAATGGQLWRCDVPDAVLSSPALAGNLIFFGSRDRHCYCLERQDGRLRWRKDLGSPVVAAPVVSGGYLYAIASGGLVYSLATVSGMPFWQFDVGKHSRTAPELVAAPVVAAEASGTRLYLGASLDYSISSAAMVYCLKVPLE